eukprot:m.267804 g.267804  ORF g.267804 m.267804 type:complete len:689 (-) comp54719_c0_seq5:99-2165(-)
MQVVDSVLLVYCSSVLLALAVYRSWPLHHPPDPFVADPEERILEGEPEAQHAWQSLIEAFQNSRPGVHNRDSEALRHLELELDSARPRERPHIEEDVPLDGEEIAISAGIFSDPVLSAAEPLQDQSSQQSRQQQQQGGLRAPPAMQEQRPAPPPSAYVPAARSPPPPPPSAAPSPPPPRPIPAPPSVQTDFLYSPQYVGQTEEEVAEESIKKFAFNEFASRKIFVNRTIPDARSSSCQEKTYRIEDLPSASIIICFVDEAWSTLMRTIRSVINRTPLALLTEIILVDDGSQEPWLREALDVEVKSIPAPKVSIIRNSGRLGVVPSRLIAAKRARGEVIVFLDSHCEVNSGWYEPLAAAIKDHKKQAVVPVVDFIDPSSLVYSLDSSNQAPSVGSFTWTLDFAWKSGPTTTADPTSTKMIDTPVLPGGIFAMNRNAFFELGGYDEQFRGWGGENMEFSFRVWMCGGRIVIHPCSHVGHIFKYPRLYRFRDATPEATMARNAMRIAEVWMDSYKQHYYAARPSSSRSDIGSLSSRLEVRRRLACKSFQWYLNTMLPSLFIPDMKHVISSGLLRNRVNRCLDKGNALSGTRVSAYSCHSKGPTQLWYYTNLREIRSVDGLCLDLSEAAPAPVLLLHCHQLGGNQEWMYNSQTHQYIHSRFSSCLDFHSTNGVEAQTCTPSKASQQWLWTSS